MVDIVHTNVATEQRTSKKIVAGKGDAFNVKSLVAAIELTAASVSDTIKFGEIPSNARIHGASRVYFDDLAASGAPTLDMGLGSVDSNVTSDDDALSDGHDLATANPNGLLLLGDIDRISKPAFELVSGQTTDPGGALEVFGTIKDAVTDTTGTVVLELFYTLD